MKYFRIKILIDLINACLFITFITVFIEAFDLHSKFSHRIYTLLFASIFYLLGIGLARFKLIINKKTSVINNLISFFLLIFVTTFLQYSVALYTGYAYKYSPLALILINLVFVGFSWGVFYVFEKIIQKLKK